jgi:phosphate transport system protein
MSEKDKKSGKKLKFRYVRNTLSEMGQQAVQAARLIVQSLTDRSGGGESQLKQIEIRLNDLEDVLEDSVLNYLNERRPKGKKLRFCTVSMKIAGDYGRVGDRALEIFKRMSRIDNFNNAPVPQSLLNMADQMKVMVEHAIESIDNRDVTLAEKVIHLHSTLVDAHKTVFEELNDNALRENPAAIQMTLIARHVDRIGDVAKSIAENVEYVVTGDATDKDDDDVE